MRKFQIEAGIDFKKIWGSDNCLDWPNNAHVFGNMNWNFRMSFLSLALAIVIL